MVGVANSQGIGSEPVRFGNVVAVAAVVAWHSPLVVAAAPGVQDTDNPKKNGRTTRNEKTEHEKRGPNFPS